MAAPLPFPQPTTPLAQSAEQVDADRRWAEWRAKGAAHDRAFRRKMAFVLPIVITVVVVAYALFAR